MKVYPITTVELSILIVKLNIISEIIYHNVDVNNPAFNAFNQIGRIVDELEEQKKLAIYNLSDFNI